MEGLVSLFPSTQEYITALDLFFSRSQNDRSAVYISLIHLFSLMLLPCMRYASMMLSTNTRTCLSHGRGTEIEHTYHVKIPQFFHVCSQHMIACMSSLETHCYLIHSTSYDHIYVISRDTLLPNPFYWAGNEPDILEPFQFNFAGTISLLYHSCDHCIQDFQFQLITSWHLFLISHDMMSTHCTS